MKKKSVLEEESNKFNSQQPEKFVTKSHTNYNTVTNQFEGIFFFFKILGYFGSSNLSRQILAQY